MGVDYNSWADGNGILNDDSPVKDEKVKVNVVG